MDSRVVAALLAAVVALTLLAPAGLGAAESPDGDATAVTGDTGDALAFDRLRTAVIATSEPSRAGESGSPSSTKRASGLADERASRHADERASGHADPDGVLEQSTRAAVFDAIAASPGETLAGLAEAVDVTKSTVQYHARVLRNADLVTSTRAGGALRFAPADANVELAAALRADGTGAVLDAVAEGEPASVSELAAATDRAPSTVSHHLSTLEDRGFVERERAGEAVVTTLTPATRTAMAVESPAPADD